MKASSSVLPSLFLILALTPHRALGAASDWPEPRGNSHLTALQRTPGAMKEAPKLLAEYDLGRVQPGLTIFQDQGTTLALALAAGAIDCFEQNGRERWKAHPRGLNFREIAAVRDLNGDWKAEILLAAGRPTDPYGAVALLSAADGQLLWRYDVEPMSYSWRVYAGRYVAGEPGEQIVVIMHGYPPDEKNGYMALFDFPKSSAEPHLRWRHEFEQYTCFPTLLQTDLDGDGVKELAVETHSRMWLFDAGTGAVKQFLQWDVAPGNVRSYGLTRFLDLNGDGLEDFLCIADFSQHHEVLLNQKGKLVEAWHHGWNESVTTGKVATRWPELPQADLDGDGKLEIVLSMFNADGEGAWAVRVYDAVTGELRARMPGMVAAACGDLDGDKKSEILATISDDSALAVRKGAALLQWKDGGLKEIWRDAAASPAPNQGMKIARDGATYDLTLNDGAVSLVPFKPAPVPPGPKFDVPPLAAATLPTLLAADLDGDGVNELLLYSDPELSVFALSKEGLVRRATYHSDVLPVIADLDGDGRNEIVLAEIARSSPPVLRAITPSLKDKELWRKVFPPPDRKGLPQPRKGYLRTIHLTGRREPDLYLWAGTPLARSVGLRGDNGEILWEKGETPKGERFWGASVNYASAFDFNGDGKEDLIFTNPDYYCVADGLTGNFLLGPSFPPDIFHQPSQGLYTYPAILDRASGKPDVALVGGHYFQAAMTVGAQPHWFKLPPTGENRASFEAFLPAKDSAWLMGFGRQNGRLACVDAATGALRWEEDLGATASDVIAGDVDGDRQYEFVLGTSHGELLAVGDAGAVPRPVWKVQVGASLGPPLLADLTGDGKCEIAVCGWDGRLRVYGASQSEGR